MVIKTEELIKKDELISNACTVLKQEFVGIDSVIDGVINNIRTWFLFPELQDRPLIINLWGLTGVGKTSLVRRLAQLLNIERDLVMFNFAEIGEKSAWEIEQDIEEQLSNERSNRIFVYDEFQYAATLDKMGAEKDNKSGLKPFWELLDTGVINKRFSYYSTKILYKMLRYMMNLSSLGNIEISNGVWINVEEVLDQANPYDITIYSDYFNFTYNNKEQRKSKQEEEENKQGIFHIRETDYEDRHSLEQNFFIRKEHVARISELCSNLNIGIDDISDFYNKAKDMTFEQMFDFIAEIYESVSKGYKLNFNDSVIFVLGNLDEAYEMSFNTDPDMSPDQFHAITNKINIVDIKTALQARFRNEQIARLGNIHLIYPSFSSDSFKKIINLTLTNYAKEVNDKCQLNLIFERSIKDVIYKESVFPTHGTRPVFSTIHEIVKTKLPLIVKHIYDNELTNCTSVKFSFKNKNVCIAFLDNDGSNIGNVKYNEKLRLNALRESTNDDEQCLVAVHESGHFVVYSALMGKLPEKLCSKTAASNHGGFLLQDINDVNKIFSKKECLNQIKISLAGFAAERLVFGEDMKTNGASSDLRQATMLASQMIRVWGMGKNVYQITYMKGGEECADGFIVNEDDQHNINFEIKKIIGECLDEVTTLLKSDIWYNMLRESAQYLSEHSTMPKVKMEEIYSKVCGTIDKCDNNTDYYRNIVKNM